VRAKQFSALNALKEVLNNDSYRITNQVRINSYQKLERPTLNAVREKQRHMEDEVEKLQARLTGTTQVLKYNIEIAEEGQSKAILVFTIVTIVFLPLSFVATLFGMNTSDLRDMNHTQTLFWQVALPLTAAIGGISLLVAYKGTLIRDKVETMTKKAKEKRSTPRRSKRAALQRFRKRDEEQGGDRELQAAPEPGNLVRRRTGVAPLVVSTRAKVAKVHQKTPPQRESRRKSVSDVSDATDSTISGVSSVNERRARTSSSRKVRFGEQGPRKRVVGIKEMFF